MPEPKARRKRRARAKPTLSIDLSHAQREALQLILVGELAWTPLEMLDPGAVAELHALGLVELWRAKWAVTLTPYGAAVLGERIVERWESGSMLEDQFAGVGYDPGGEVAVRLAKVRVGLVDEAPSWAGPGTEVPPLVVPRHARERPFLFDPDSVAAPPGSEPDWGDEPAAAPGPEPRPGALAELVLGGRRVSVRVG